jgi:hypothetical protein
MKAMALIGQGRLNERKTGAEGGRERCEIEFSNKHDATNKSRDNRHAKNITHPPLHYKELSSK